MQDAPAPDDFRFEVAISYASERKDYVREVARLLGEKLSERRVFFDEWRHHETAGRDGHIALQKNYHIAATRLVVVFFSRQYNRTRFTRDEWRAIQDFDSHQQEADSAHPRLSRLLMFKFEEVQVDGVYGGDIVSPVGKQGPEQIAAFILDHLEALKQKSASAGDRPDPLAMLIRFAQQDRLVVVLDDVLDADAAVSRSALTDALAREAGSTPDLLIAGSILEQRLGREGLRERVTRELASASGVRTAPYQALARLPISTVVSLFPDLVLEMALAGAQKPFRCHVADDAMAVHELEPGTRDLFLLGGSARFGTGLILTRKDYEGAVAHTEYLRRGIHWARRAVLLLGCNLLDARFRKLFYLMSQTRTLHDAPLFVTGAHSFDGFWQRWQPIGIDLTPRELLQTFERGVSASAVGVIAPPAFAQPPPTRPYRYLDYFTRADVAFFFGREAATQGLAREILASTRRITVLCGRSGTGKTSLVHAGLFPFLEHQHGFRTVYTRCGADPVASICSGVDGDCRVPASAPPEFLANVLRDAYAKDPRLQIVCIDQFEEALIKLGPRVLDGFAESLEACLRDPEGVTRFLIVIREDYLSRLSALGRIVSGILTHTYPLDDLTRDEARAAIIRPAELCHIRVEDGLVDAVLNDLSPVSVLPAHLQIVCDRVLEEAKGERVLSLDIYRRLRCVSGILASHLEHALAEMPKDLDRAAKRVLTALVTSEQTKDLLDLEQIVKRSELPADVVPRVIHDLVHRCRLVREVPGRELVFELSHESLAQAVSIWLDHAAAQVRVAQELLNRELNEAAKFEDHVIGSDRLRLIETHRGDLKIESPAVVLIAASYATRGESLSGWSARLAELEPEARLEAQFYRPLRHDSRLLSELVARAGALPSELPADIEDTVMRWLRTANFDALLRTLPNLLPRPGIWSLLMARCQELPREQIRLLLRFAGVAEGLASVTLDASRKRVSSPSSGVIIVALLELPNSFFSGSLRGPLLNLLKQRMYSEATSSLIPLAPVCDEVAQWLIREPAAARHFTSEQSLLWEAVHRHATLTDDLTMPAIEYLFRDRAEKYLVQLLGNVTPKDQEMIAALERGLSTGGALSWSILNAAVAQYGAKEQLISLACRHLSTFDGHLSRNPGPRKLAMALCEVTGRLQKDVLVEVARCLVELKDPRTEDAFIANLVRLGSAEARSLFHLGWMDREWAAWNLRARCSDVMFAADICALLLEVARDASTQTIVAVLEEDSDFSLQMIAALSQGVGERSPTERRRLLQALAGVRASSPSETVAMALCRCAIHDSAANIRALGAALANLLTLHGGVPWRGVDEALVILRAFEHCARRGRIAPISNYLTALAGLRGHDEQVDQELGALFGKDSIAATESLLSGSKTEQLAVLDVMALMPIEPLSPPHRALRKIVQTGDPVLRVRAASLLMKTGDDTGLQSTVGLLGSKRAQQLHQTQLQSCENDVREYISELSPDAVRSLLPHKHIGAILLAELVRNRRDMLSNVNDLAWVLTTLSRLEWSTGAAIRAQLSNDVAALLPALTHLAEHGNSKQKYQARLLLAQSPAARAGEDGA